LVPAHLQALHAHLSRFGLRVGAEGRGSQIENHETHTETCLRRSFHGPCGMPEVAEVAPRGKAAPIMWGRIQGHGSRTRN
jgi:hypothetical protein